MSKDWNYKSGDWLLICDICSKKIKASLSKKRWDGFITCPDCYENRHPQDFIRAKMDKISVPFSRPKPAEIFITGICTLASSSAYVGLAAADCAQTDQTWNMSYRELLDTDLCSVQTKTGIAGIGIAGCMRPMYNADAYL